LIHDRSPLTHPRGVDVSQYVSEDRDHEEHARAINHMPVQSFRLSDGQASGPDPVGIVETIHFPFLLAPDTTNFVPNHPWVDLVCQPFQQCDALPHAAHVSLTGHIELSDLFHTIERSSTDSEQVVQRLGRNSVPQLSMSQNRHSRAGARLSGLSCNLFSPSPLWGGLGWGSISTLKKEKNSL
jgi:hypothetical protein